jgi:hypothetical protein
MTRRFLQLKPGFPGWPADPAIQRQGYRRSGGICNGNGAGLAPAASLTGRRLLSE